MGLRFRRSVKLFPGVKINFGKSGVSTTIGVPGASINVSRRGTRGTVGVPGTGISYTEHLSTKKIQAQRSLSPTVISENSVRFIVWIVLVLVCVLVLFKALG